MSGPPPVPVANFVLVLVLVLDRGRRVRHRFSSWPLGISPPFSCPCPTHFAMLDYAAPLERQFGELSGCPQTPWVLGISPPLSPPFDEDDDEDD